MMKLSQSEKMRSERRLKGAMDAATAGVGVIVKMGRKLMSANVRRTEEESITPIVEKAPAGSILQNCVIDFVCCKAGMPI